MKILSFSLGHIRVVCLNLGFLYKQTLSLKQVIRLITSGNTRGDWREETGIGRIPYRVYYQASWKLGKWNSVSLENSLGNRTYLYAGAERSLGVRELEHLPTSISHWLKSTLKVNSVLSMGEAGNVDSSRQRISCSSHRYLQLEVRPNAWKS